MGSSAMPTLVNGITIRNILLFCFCFCLFFYDTSPQVIRIRIKRRRGEYKGKKGIFLRGIDRISFLYTMWCAFGNKRAKKKEETENFDPFADSRLRVSSLLLCWNDYWLCDWESNETKGKDSMRHTRITLRTHRLPIEGEINDGFTYLRS